MNVTLISPVSFEKWDYRSPDDPGIGGSETAVVETAWRLARRGHDVVVYAPIREDCPSEWRGTKWLPLEAADYARPGWWLISRSPETLDHFPAEHPGQHLAITMQDTSYPQWNEERLNKADRLIALCPSHYYYSAIMLPTAKDKVCLGFNGIRPDVVREVSANPPERNPRRIIFASSPDRGLLPLLKIFRRAREWVSDLELYIGYGLDNIKHIIASNPPTPHWKNLADEIERSVQYPGITWLGRIGQKELYRQKAAAGMSVHCTEFFETGMISVLEEMALGAIPIITPAPGAAKDYSTHGVWVYGDPEDPLTLARFTGEVYRLATDLELQEKIRGDMQRWARSVFSWERYIDKLESWMYDYRSPGANIFCQFGFSLKHATGKILNVGCCDDAACLKESRGAINLDVHSVDPALERPNKVDVVLDARDLPGPFEEHSFDCVNCTEMLEHFENEDVPEQLIKFKRLLRPGGRIVITVPDDHRDLPGISPLNGTTHYADGITYKHHRISDDTVDGWLKEAGLKAIVRHPLEYNWDEALGHAMVLVPEEEVDAAR